MSTSYPTANAVALARHTPSSLIGRYDEETCESRLPDGTKTITLLNLTDDSVLLVAPKSAVEFITYEEYPDDE